MQKMIVFIKKEAVLLISLLAAAISALAVPPDAAWLGYIDLRVLCLLLGLMLASAGLRDAGVGAALARGLTRSGRAPLVPALVALPFFASMAVTNDVALIAFVPLAAASLEAAGRQRQTAWVVVLQTLAANLGSMATPVGNPQNLFLYSAFSLGAGDFFGTVLPVAGVSLLALGVAALITERAGRATTALPRVQPSAAPAVPVSRWAALAWAGLLALCLLAVFRTVHYAVAAGAAVVLALALRPRLLARVDWALLATFVCFFIFSGNLGRMEAVDGALRALMAQSPLLTPVAASQVISNVPAAVLLGGFTENWRALLIGVNVGGLGTPIASLASLISLRLYARSDGARPGRYIALFTLANLAGLALLLPLAAALR